MRQIRNGVFETNSSSTHALSMTKNYIDQSEFDNSIFEKTYIIKPFRSSEVNDIMQFTSVEDKLRYFLTLYYQTWYYNDDPDAKRIRFMKLLQQIFPNTIFVLDFENGYVFEDGEWFFDDVDSECNDLIDEYTLKKFMLYGTIDFGDRNNERYWDKVRDIRNNNSLWEVSWSG